MVCLRVGVAPSATIAAVSWLLAKIKCMKNCSAGPGHRRDARPSPLTAFGKLVPAATLNSLSVDLPQIIHADLYTMSIINGLSAPPGSSRLIKHGDLAIAYERFDSMKAVYVDEKGRYQNRWGCFLMKVGAPGCTPGTHAPTCFLFCTCALFRSSSDETPSPDQNLRNLHACRIG